MATVQDAINNCDIVSLPAEHAELLLKLLPTKDEVTNYDMFHYYFSSFFFHFLFLCILIDYRLQYSKKSAAVSQM